MIVWVILSKKKKRNQIQYCHFRYGDNRFVVGGGDFCNFFVSYDGE